MKFLVFFTISVILMAMRIQAMEIRGECPCTKEWDPVCASNNNTYSNPCRFACAKKEADNMLTIQFAGSCDRDGTVAIELGPTIMEGESTDETYIIDSA